MPFPTDAKSLATAQSIVPEINFMDVDANPALDGFEQASTVLANDLVLFANVNVPNDAVKQVVAAIHAGKETLVATFPGLALFEPDQMARRYSGVSYHEGAQEFYQEQGL